MINNDVLRSIRYMLDLSDARVVEIVHLVDPAFPIEKSDVQAMLRRRTSRATWSAAIACWRISSMGW